MVDADGLVDIPGQPADEEPLRCSVEGCTNAVIKPARGRTPKNCDEHRNTKPGTGPKKSWAKATQVEAALNKYVDGLSLVVSLVNPVDGTIIAKGTPAVVHEIIELARVDPKLRKTLEAISAPGKYGPLMLALGSLALPLMVNHKLLPQFLVAGLTPETDGGE